MHTSKANQGIHSLLIHIPSQQTEAGPVSSLKKAPFTEL